MIRVLFAVLIPLFLPAVVYILWRTFAPARIGGSKKIQRGDWEQMPWLPLSVAGVVLLAAMLAYLAIASGAELGLQYAQPASAGDS